MAIYVIRAGNLDLYKIGVARNPEQRLAALQTASPFHLTLVLTIDGDRATERHIHAALHEARARGEWFEIDTEPTVAEVKKWAKHNASRSTPDPVDEEGDPVGAKEIAERLDVATATVDQWKWRGILPAPKWTVGGRPAWNWPDIERWAKTTGRL